MTALRRVLIFDLDGTLIDSNGPHADLFCEMLERECGVTGSTSRPVYTRLLDKGPKAQFATVLAQVGMPDASLVDDMTRRYWLRAETQELVLFPEVLDVLEELRRAGHTLVVSTGSVPASAKRKTRVTGIDRLFRLILGSDEDVPGLAKGAGHFGLIAEALSLTPVALRFTGAFIGDGVYDMEVAREAGILGIGRLTGDNADVLLEAGAKHVIPDLRALLPFFAS